jgi:uncharacterized protein
VATLPSSLVICADPELMTIAVERQRIYQSIWDRISTDQQAALKADQSRWLKEYASECGVPPDRRPQLPPSAAVTECFKRAGLDRNEYLRRYTVNIGKPTPITTTPADGSSSPTFQQGQADHESLEIWFSSQVGDYRAGAEYWASHRSLRNPQPCDAAPPSMGAEWTAGCTAAQQRLAGPEARRKKEPEYRLGWNNWGPETTPQSPPTKTRFPQSSPERPPKTVSKPHDTGVMFEERLAACKRDKGTKKIFTLPGSGGKPVQLDHCYRGPQELNCTVTAIDDSAQEINSKYDEIVRANYPDLTDVSKEICRLDPKTIEEQLRESRQIKPQADEIQKAYQHVSICISKVRDAVQKVDLRGMRNSQALADSIRKSFDTPLLEASQRLQNIKKLVDQIGDSQSAMETVQQIRAAMCR